MKPSPTQPAFALSIPARTLCLKRIIIQRPWTAACRTVWVRRSTAMARIIGGIAASHTPTIGFAYDRNKRDDPVWAPIFTNFAPLSAWLAEKKPDVLVLIYNDHVSSFFFDHYPTFALRIRPQSTFP